MNDIARLLGRRPCEPRELPKVDTSSDDVTEIFNDEYQREVALDRDSASDVGQVVHQYASQPDPVVRGVVDLAGLQPYEIDWLLSLSEADLHKLAAAGPRACQLAIRGRKCGIIALSVPRVAEPKDKMLVPEPEQSKADQVREALRTRVQLVGMAP